MGGAYRGEREWEEHTEERESGRSISRRERVGKPSPTTTRDNRRSAHQHLHLMLSPTPTRTNTYTSCPHKHLHLMPTHTPTPRARTNTYTSCPHKHLHLMPAQTPTPHAHLILKGVYVEIIELLGVRVALRTYVSVKYAYRQSSTPAGKQVRMCRQVFRLVRQVFRLVRQVLWLVRESVSEWC